ncbi:MAG: CBS domain-containing protein [Gemmatimonadota bacterium]|nr:CBS domain-containing protein [Gemmatimonadota bacterium]
MKIEEILHRKGREVVTITEEKTILDAVQVLVEHNIGGVVVVHEGRPVGILTERDVLRVTSRNPLELHAIRVNALMTRDMVTATPESELHQVMEVMTERRIRHLPVLEDGRLVGIVSIGDLMKSCLVKAEEENLQLKDYIRGAV